MNMNVTYTRERNPLWRQFDKIIGQLQQETLSVMLLRNV